MQDLRYVMQCMEQNMLEKQKLLAEVDMHFLPQ